MPWRWPGTNHRRVRPCAPRLAVDRIGTKAGLVPEIDLGLVSLGLARNRGIRLTLPAGNRIGVTLIRPLQGLLWCQALSRQHRADRSQAQAHAESPDDQFARTICRVQRPKSNPYCLGFLPLSQRNTCHSCAAVRVRGRPVAGRAANALSPWPRPRAALSQR